LVSNISTSKKSTKKTDESSKQSAQEDQAYIASLLLAANDEYRKFAIRVAALRAGYVDMMAAAGRRLAEADNELEDLEILARKSNDGFSTRKDLELALEPLLWQYNPRLHRETAKKDYNNKDKESDNKKKEGSELEEKNEDDDNDDKEEENEDDEDEMDVTEALVAGVATDQNEKEKNSKKKKEEDEKKKKKKKKNKDSDDDSENEEEEEEEEDVKRMSLPKDWIVFCKTPRDLITAMKSRVVEEQQSHEEMIKMMTASQGTRKKRKKVTGKVKKKEKPLSDRAKRKAKRKV
jgi:hypothetical protein